MTDSDDPKVTVEEAAFHEAGHAAVMLSSGLSVDEVSIKEGEHQWYGSTVWGLTHSPNLETPRTLYAVNCAGLIAIVLRRGNLIERDLNGAGIGVHPADRYDGDAAKAGRVKCLDSAEAWQFAVVTLRENWGFVWTLATYLAKTELSMEDELVGDKKHTASKGTLGELWQPRNQSLVAPTVTRDLEEAEDKFRTEAGNHSEAT